MTTLYLDLDGMLADFDGHFVRLFGRKPNEISKSLKWGLVASKPDFFYTMPMLAGAISFFNQVRCVKPEILTGCSHSNYESEAKQKRRWARLNLDPNIRVIPCLGSSRKFLFMHEPGDVLVDDRADVCEAWSKHGGRAFLFTGDFVPILSELRTIFPTIAGARQ